MTKQSLIHILRQVDQVEFFASDLLVEAEHILGLILEVRSRTEAAGDENSVGVVLYGLVSFSNANEFLPNCADQIEGELDLLLWLVGLDYSADDSNVCVFLADTVDCRNHHNVDIYNRIKGYHCFF